MSLEKTVNAYEILVRFHPDGKVGASFREETRVTDDGVVVSSVISPPVAIDLVELQTRIGVLTEQDWYVPEPELQEPEV